MSIQSGFEMQSLEFGRIGDLKESMPSDMKVKKVSMLGSREKI